MIRLLKIFLVIICFNVLQFCLEILFMSILEKMGVSYMGMENKGETFKEIFIATIGFYYYSRLVLLGTYVLVTTVFILSYFRNKEISFKNVATVQIAVSLVIFLILWVSFGNGFAFIANPLLGLLLAGLSIYLLASQFRKPIVRQKATAL